MWEIIHRDVFDSQPLLLLLLLLLLLPPPPPVLQNPRGLNEKDGVDQ